MRILDRYIISTFLKNYCISLVVLIGLYVVLDMVFNFDEIAAIRSRAGLSGVEGVIRTLTDVADYYFYQSFLIFVQLSGIIPVAAAGFTLLRMSRFNELTAWLAAGIPMLRIAMPIVICAVLLNGFLIIDQELILPRMVPKLVRAHEDMHEESAKAFSINAMQDENKNVLFATTYQPPTAKSAATMSNVDIVERDENNDVVALTSAAVAVWNGAKLQWDLTDGKRTTGLRADQTREAPEPRTVFKSSINPEEIAIFRSSNVVQLLSTSRINELLARPKSYGSSNLLRMKHLRFTQPIMNVILLLLTIPAVLTHDATKLKSGASRCLMLAGTAMSAVFLFQQLANHPPSGGQWIQLWPALMAWAPIFIFAPIAVWLLDRVST